jgi:hypothetical protein
MPPKVDSPVFTFLDLENNREVRNLIAENPGQSISFNDLMKEAEKLKKRKEYDKALTLLTNLKNLASENMAYRDSLSLIVCRQALCTYKNEQPNKLDALNNARIILEELTPQSTDDLEVLGLSGAISKRLYEITGKQAHLDDAIWFYENYNGINAAFMLYLKYALLKADHQDWDDIKLKADYIRNEVLQVCLSLASEKDFENRDDANWILYTIAEAYHYKGNATLMAEFEQKAGKLAALKNDDFSTASYQTQKTKIQSLS